MEALSHKFWLLPTFTDERGPLTILEDTTLPFSPKRLYFLYDVKAKRGGHAHLKEEEVFVCIRGTFTARIHDGKQWHQFEMTEPGMALYTNALVWHEFDNFSPDAIMLAVSSTNYDGQKEYILDHNEFLQLCSKKS
ncbi:hypothetical protein CO046_00645 [Candidatus Peregrinibacteria bacterium CG_4_9_14_0_2_um_filter_53_11]|nr:MAG: hypothetical protein CO046_00645 [Candidatus Peregrinibacteria bacterium CG_4_9_14_0_2_um_filter_53_11]